MSPQDMDPWQESWSLWRGLALFSLSLISLVLGWAILTLPPQYARPAFLGVAPITLLSFYGIHEIFPDELVNMIWGMALLQWICHMCFVLYIRRDKTPPRNIQQIGFVATVMMLYRSHFLPNRRAALKMVFNCRGIGTPWEVDLSPTPDNRFQNSSRWKFCLQRVARIVGRYALHYICGRSLRHMISLKQSDYSLEKRVFFRRLLAGQTNTSREVIVRLWVVFNWVVPCSLILESYHDFCAILFVGRGVDTAEEWPSLFGNITEAYTLRRYWTRFRHKHPYRSYSAFASLLSTWLLGTSQGTIWGRYLKNTLVFFISGAAHFILWRRLNLDCASGPIFLWYVAQPIGLATEAAVQYLWRKYRNQNPTYQGSIENTVTLLVGYMWVLSWLFWSMPKYAFSESYCLG